MRYLVLPFILLALTGCQALTTFDKYATMRLYEVYEAENLSACDYKPQFRDCTVDEVKNLLSVMDAWYAGTFSGKQLT